MKNRLLGLCTMCIFESLQFNNQNKRNGIYFSNFRHHFHGKPDFFLVLWRDTEVCLSSSVDTSIPVKSSFAHRQLRNLYVCLEYARLSLASYLGHASPRMRLFQIANGGKSTIQWSLFLAPRIKIDSKKVVLYHPYRCC